MINPTRHKLKLIRSIVNGKHIVLLGNSPTVSFLVENREFFRGKDYVYVCMNHWPPIERDFLCPIDRGFDILMTCSPKPLRRDTKETEAFTYRDNTALIVEDASDQLGNFNQESLFDVHFVEVPNIRKRRTHPELNLDTPSTWSKAFPTYKEFKQPMLHTVMNLLPILSCGEPLSITVFGCDGGVTADFTKEQKKYCHYDCQSKSCHGYIYGGRLNPKYERGIKRWSKCHEALTKHMEKTFGFERPPIYLAGEHSNYKFGKKIAFKNILKFMRKQK